jgi:copper chaperone
MNMSVVQETVLSVPDISCQHCVNAINGALKVLPGIETVDTDIPTKTVHLRYEPAKISLEEVEAVLDDVGYTIAK